MRRLLLVDPRCRGRRSATARAARRLRPGEHGAERDFRRAQGVPPRDATRAARQARADGAPAQSVRRPATFAVPDTPRWRTHGGDFLLRATASTTP